VPDETHLQLFVEVVNGKAVREPVHVADLGEGRFRLLYSPGFVQGIAAGDEFRLVDADGRFDVIARGGNLVVQMFSREAVRESQTELVARVGRLDGTLDGAIEQGLSFTIPLAVGFPAIESLFNEWVEAHSAWTWHYGNVYSTIDLTTPLNWWLPPRSDEGSAENFAHGTYADDSGVVFYGPPMDERWSDRLPVSDRFIEPLFKALLDRAKPGKAPTLVAEWNEHKGCANATGIQKVPRSDATEFLVAFGLLTVADVTPHVAGVTSDQCLQCAAAIAEFLRDRIDRGLDVYIEDD
jgi:hypothetical protein